MNFLILRRGQKLGPYPDGAVEKMHAQGELRAGDLVCYEGEQSWLPVSKFLEHRQQRVEGMAITAEVAGEPVAARAGTPSKTSFLRRSVEERDDATLTEAEREVIAGGRFLAYEYCWSLVVSFKHTSQPLLVRAGDDGFGAAFRYSLISVFLGWWGIPGPVWAFTTLSHNARGGHDVTLETLTRQVGHARAAAACARRQASAPPGAALRALGGMVGALSLAVCLGMGWLVWAFAQGDLGEPAPGPGSKEFDVANRALVEAKRSSIYGNVQRALEIADSFNKNVGTAYLAMEQRAANATSGQTNRVIISTFCELHEDRVVFLVRVADLQKLPASQIKHLADEAWRASSLALTETKAGFTGLRVAVGLSSSSKYEQVLTGRYIRDFEANNTGLKSRSVDHRSKSKLYGLFLPKEQLDSWKDE